MHILQQTGLNSELDFLKLRDNFVNCHDYKNVFLDSASKVFVLPEFHVSDS